MGRKISLVAVEVLERGTCADDNTDSFDSPEKAENVKADIKTIIQPGGGGGVKTNLRKILYQKTNVCLTTQKKITMKGYSECNGIQRMTLLSSECILTFQEK